MADTEGTEKTEKAEKAPTEKVVKGAQSREDKKCSQPDCKRPYRAKGYCNVHYAAWRNGEMEKHKARYKICSKEACKKPMATSRWGLCEDHYKEATGKTEEAAKA